MSLAPIGEHEWERPVVIALDGAHVEATSLWAKRRCVVAMLRHAGAWRDSMS
jgi:hypothetical protein